MYQSEEVVWEFKLLSLVRFVFVAVRGRGILAICEPCLEAEFLSHFTDIGQSSGLQDVVYHLSHTSLALHFIFLRPYTISELVLKTDRTNIFSRLIASLEPSYPILYYKIFDAHFFLKLFQYASSYLFLLPLVEGRTQIITICPNLLYSVMERSTFTLLPNLCCQFNCHHTH